MTPQVDGKDVAAWAKRVKSYDGDTEHRQILDQLAIDPSATLALLDALTGHADPIVRSWAGTTAAEVLGADAIPLLHRLRADRDSDVRDSAREDLIGLDPTFLQTLLPDYRRALRRRKDPWGADATAMFAVARARDREAIPLLRDYAAQYEARYWHNRMPLVLADYIEDPTSVTQRICNHDHDFMFWLIQAAESLDVPDAADAMREALDRSVDEACGTVIRERLEWQQLVTSQNAD